MDQTLLIRVAERHIRLRNLGYLLFFTGLLLMAYTVWHTSHSHEWINLLFGFASVATGLAVFGVNHDTAIALTVLVHNQEQSFKVSPVLLSEYEEDLDWDRAATLALKPHVKSAYFIIFLSIGIQMFLLSRFL